MLVSDGTHRGPVSPSKVRTSRESKGEEDGGVGTCQMVNEHVLTTVKSRVFAPGSSARARMAE